VKLTLIFFHHLACQDAQKDQLFKIYEKVIPKPICITDKITDNNDHPYNSGSSSIHNEQT
jgi:hypothetical protein